MHENEKIDILIFSASYGGGHRRVSYAVQNAINKIDSNIKTRVLDLFEYISPKINKANAYTYVTTMRNFPQLYGFAYELTYDLSMNNILNRITSKIGHDKLISLINKLKPSVILSTYPTYVGILSELKRKRLINVISTVVITDFVAHSQWIYPFVDQYFVPSDEVRYHLIKKGVPPDTILITGIPISEVFLQKSDKGEVFTEFQLNEKIPVLLVMAGIFGMTRGIIKICEVIMELSIELQAVVLCGNDKRLFNKLITFKNKIKPVYGHVDVNKLMDISSILISKSGGITVSEALAKELPIVVYKPLPGQEFHNAMFLSKTGSGIIVNDENELKNILNLLLIQRVYLDKMRESARLIKKPTAAQDIAKNLVEKVGRSVFFI